MTEQQRERLDSGEWRALQKLSAKMQLLMWVGAIAAGLVSVTWFAFARPTRSEVMRTIVKHAPSRLELAAMEGKVQLLNDRYAGVNKRLDKFEATILRKLEMLSGKMDRLRDDQVSSGGGDIDNPPRRKKRRRRRR